MRLKASFFTLLLSLFAHAIEGPIDTTPRSAVTYASCGGRFGDFLLHYLHAKWFAYQHDLPLLYWPFEYSNQLSLDDMEIPFGAFYGYTEFPLGHITELFPEPTLYLCPYFPEVQMERRSGEWHYSHQVDWKDPEFRKLVRQLVSPKKELALIKPPEHTINIALHYRDGGGFDSIRGKRGFPLKFPSIQFYTEGLRKIAAYFPKKAFYCFVFTDAVDPSSIVDEIERMVPYLKITFDCRGKEGGHDVNVLEDFFSLFAFDVLIRPASNYSIVASLIHDYAIVYSPLEAIPHGLNRVQIVNFEVDRELCEKLLLR